MSEEISNREAAQDGRRERVLHDPAGGSDHEAVAVGRVSWLWRPTGLVGWVLVGVVVLLVGLASGRLVSFLIGADQRPFGEGLWLDPQPAAAERRDAVGDDAEAVDDADDEAEDQADAADRAAEDRADAADDAADAEGDAADTNPNDRMTEET